MEENTESITEQADISSKQCKDYPKDTWKDNVKFWSACYFELFVEHIHKIFITVMSMNILWIQIITSQMGIQKSYRGIIEIIEWVMIIITLLYIIQILWHKARTAWKKLEKWAEE